MTSSQQRTLFAVAIIAIILLSYLTLSTSAFSKHTAAYPLNSLRPADHKHCLPEFPYQQGWLGGDVASSVLLSKPNANITRTLWFFGDTFIGKEGADNRFGSNFINNSVAHARCGAKGHWTIRYGWLGADSAPAAVFPAPADGQFYWPMTAAVYNGMAIVVLAIGEKVDVRQGGAQFKIVGVDLAAITNPAEPVERWKIRYSPIMLDDVVIPASAAIIADDYLYLYGFFQHKVGLESPGPRFISRIPLNKIAQFPPKLSRFLEKWDGSTWRVDAAPAVIMDDNASEMGIQALPDGCGWLATYLAPHQPGEVGFSARIYVRTATDLAGPWSDRRLLATVPEMDENFVNGYQPGTFCYAAKTHPELSPADRLLYTYVCNILFDSWEGVTIFNAMNVYVPRPVLEPLPTPGHHSGIDNTCPWLIQ